MTSAEILAAIRAHDHALPEHLGSPPASLPEDLAPSVSGLDAESRLLLVNVIATQNAPGAGKLLLTLTGDDLQVAGAAAHGLLGLKKLPPTADILHALPKCEDPVVRGTLYLAAGKAGDAAQLGQLRQSAAGEKDPDVQGDAQAAAVKLGGKPERSAFVARVQAAPADQVMRCRDHLLYIGDPALAKAMLPWLGKDDGVIRLGSDRPPQKMARMKDIAVWTAHNLGVKFNITPEYLTNFAPPVIQECFRALSALPNP